MYHYVQTWRLVKFANTLNYQQQPILINAIDNELKRRTPPDHHHFGDCAGKPIFLPIEKYDNRGQLIISEMIGYDSRGNEVWL